MAELKTKATDASVTKFVEGIEPADKKADAQKLLELFSEITGDTPVMWGPSMIGFGKYHYQSERSAQKGDWFLSGFSPRKQNLTLYIMAGNQDESELFKKLGKHTTSVGCVYIKHLADVDETILRKLIKNSYNYMKKTHQKG